MLQLRYVAAALVLASAGESAARAQVCPPEPWEAAVEDWATAARGNTTRHGRIMSLPASQGYYVSDRIDLVPPPAPPQLHRRGPHPAPPPYPHAPPPAGTHNGAPPANSYSSPTDYSYNSYQPPAPNRAPNGSHWGPQYGPAGQQNEGPPLKGSPPDTSMPYDEWAATPPPPPPPGSGKIVNRPPNPYKDQFKPSYAPPPHSPIPVSADRVDAAPPPPPQKQVSETDLYLLRAIEKLVYRVDLMEKRMRKMEENMHLIVAGAQHTPKPEPCERNFTRIGSRCYHFSSEAANWKSASYACRKLKANLLELDADEKRHFLSGLLANDNLKGADLWTGGLNPGLLWIWSHSAKPVAGNSTESASVSIAGEGRCLALVWRLPAAAGGAEYRGQECALRHRYVCERDDPPDTLPNEIERLAKSVRDQQQRNRTAEVARD